MLLRDTVALENAVVLLEFPTFGDKLTNAMGKPIDKAMSMMPQRLQKGVNSAADRAIQWALDWVLRSVDTTKIGKRPADKRHKALAMGTGFAGGLAGGWGVVIELPLSTGIMLRSIADIARAEGENLTIAESRMACVEVLALDTSHPTGNHASVGAYYALRKALNTAVVEALTYLTASAGATAMSEVAATGARSAADVALQTSSRKTVPALVHVAQRVAERYGLTVSEQAAAQLIPLIGGIGGAAVNYIFTDHFQRMAHGHFTVRRLERVYGELAVEHAYQRIRREAIQLRG